MPIAPLSDSTARAISSTLVLNDAVSVVKELLDNALDAKARNITVEISSNALDIIQVKDNGAGIGIEDRQVLCRRGLTSKIRTLDDLAQLGGTFLGFRGEALASIAELSGCVIITTRVDGETVATTLKHDKSGKLIDSFSASHGTGTTVRVQDFLKSIPVRKQTAQKQAAKILNEVKKLLFDYAYARPTVRFLLKVLKTKSEKGNWSYIPSKDTHEMVNTASKIAGKEIVEICKEHSATSPCGSYVIQVLVLSKDNVEFLKASGTGQHFSVDGRPITSEQGLAKRLAKIYKLYIQNTTPNEAKTPARPFIYIRLSCPRGSYDVNIEPAKNVVMFEDQEVICDLFEGILRAQYGEKRPKKVPERDNEEGAHKSVLSTFDLLLASKKPREMTLEGQLEKNVTTASSMLASNRNTKAPITDIAVPTHAKTQKSYSTMYHLNDDDEDDGEDEVSRPTMVSEDDETLNDEEEDVMDPQVTNPFTLAKLNTRLSPIKVATNDSSKSAAQKVGLSPFTKPSISLLSDQLSASPTAAITSRTESHLPSPSRSPENDEPYQNPGPPNRPWRRRIDSLEEEEVPSESEADEGSSLAQPKLLDACIKKINTPLTVNLTESNMQETGTENGSHRSFQEVYSIGSTSSSPIRRSQPHQAPFLSPLKSSCASGSSTSPEGRSSNRNAATKPSATISPLSLLRSSTLPDSCPGQSIPQSLHRSLGDQSDLNNIMNFEVRKRDTILQHRKSQGSTLTQGNQRSSSKHNTANTQFVVPSRPQNEGQKHREVIEFASRFDEDVPPQPISASYTQNPHWNRYKAAIRDLDDPQINSRDTSEPTTQSHTNHVPSLLQDSDQPQLSESDPRAYLIHQMHIAAARGTNAIQKPEKQFKRSKTSHLPFETIIASCATFRLIAEPGYAKQERFPLPKEELAGIVCQLSVVDPYVKSGRTDCVQWKDFISPGMITELAVCEKRLNMLVADTFRLGTSNVAIDDESPEARARIEIKLEKSLRAHFAQLESVSLGLEM